jgi:hypothetical protein
MTNRREWDLPATMIAVVLGLLIIGASLPFTVQAYCRQNGCGGEPPAVPKQFDVAWQKVDAASAPLLRLDNGHHDGTSSVDVTATLVATVQVTAVGCDSDRFNPQLGQKPATITWTLKGGSKPATGHFTCADLHGPVFLLNLSAPDIGRIDAQDLAAARASLWGKAAPANTTATYTLTASWVRPPSTVEPPVPVPGGVGATSLNVGLDLKVQKWTAQVTPHPEEVTVR